MPHAYEVKYPLLAKKYQDNRDNIGVILSVIAQCCGHLFQLDDLEGLLQEDKWDAGNNYLDFFERCIQNSGKGYTEEEIKATLFPYLYEKVNSAKWSNRDYSVPQGGTRHPGFWEKFKSQALHSDLTKNDVLRSYAFTTLDMSRTAQKGAGSKRIRVLELNHLPYLKNIQDLKGSHLYIRSQSADKKGLSQWILLYYNKQGKLNLYSESPITEEDKQTLKVLYPNKTPNIEGGSAAISMSSGIRAAAHFVQNFGGAGLSSSADYFSLLIEWVWYTSGSHPSGSSKWGWGYFKEHVLQWDQYNHKFALMNFMGEMGYKRDNEHIQMRSYFLGLDWALADTPSRVLEVNTKESEVTLKVTQQLVQSNEIEETYVHQGHGQRARYSYNRSILNRRTTSDSESYSTFANTLVLNVFRACAKEKKLTIALPQQFQLDADEKALVCYLMEMNPFVCDFQNPEKNHSLAEINDKLQHIFARNRLLSNNNYLPPLLDEFWVVAAEYWVAYLKTSPDFMAEKDHEANEFKRCVREMGIHGLVPFLNYLNTQESELKPAFNALLQNIEKSPVFYGGCRARDVSSYTKTLITHLDSKHYFPFKQFQFSFVPEVNNEILDLLTALNQREIFDKISLTDCLVSEQSKRSLEDFLHGAITRANQDNDWNCPIHIPELEKPLDDRNLLKVIGLYHQLNNILVKRTREKHAKTLFDNPMFAKAAKYDEEHIPQVPGQGDVKEAQASDVLVHKFREGVNSVWKENTQLPLARMGGLSLQMQQQQQIKQERSRCLDNEMEKGMAYSDVLPSLLIDYNNVDTELGAYFKELNAEHPIDINKALLSGETPLQAFFHTWVNANPTVVAPYTIHKMTPYAAKMLLKFHRQLSGGLNVENLPRGFYTQRLASGELVLAYKSTLGFTTDHNPLTMQLTTAIPKVERVLGDHRQFEGEEGFYHVQLLAQMQPWLTPKEQDDCYKRFHSFELHMLPQNQHDFYVKNSDWIKRHWELFYAAYRANALECLINRINDGSNVVLENLQVNALLLQSEPVRAILNSHPDIDCAKALGQIYSNYGQYGLTRFSNLIVTLKNRLGEKFTHTFIGCYLRHCETFSPLLQEKALHSLDQMITALSSDPAEAELFQMFIHLHMPAVGWEDISLLWKGYHYFYSHIREMGLEQDFTPQMLAAITPRRQNLFPCFQRILKSLEQMPNQELRKEFVTNLPNLDFTEGGVPYAIAHDGFVLVDDALHLTDFKDGSPTYKAPIKNLYQNWKEPLFTLRTLASKSHIKSHDYQSFKKSLISKDQLIWAIHTEWRDANEFRAFFNDKSPKFVTIIARQFHRLFYLQNQNYRRYPLALFDTLHHHAQTVMEILSKYSDTLVLFDSLTLVHENLNNPGELQRIFNLFLLASPTKHPHLDQGFLLASVYGVQPAQLLAFFEKTVQLKQITRNELSVLVTQLTSVNLATLPQDAVLRNALWEQVLSSVDEMDNNPLQVSELRKELMQRLKDEHHLVFKSSLSGDYRMVKDDDLQCLGLDQFFEQHHKRLHRFLTSHVAIAESEKNDGPLKPLIEFFKRLQLNKTYINEVEPLLATLEKVMKDNPNGCWTASYLSEMLRSLQPEDESAGFSMSMLEALLAEVHSPFKPVLLDEVQPHFDMENKWQGILSAILAKAQTFSRAQQANIARLAVRNSQDQEFINRLVSELSPARFEGLRDAVLSRLLAERDPEQFSNVLNQCSQLAMSLDKAAAHLWIDTLHKHSELVPVLLTLQHLESPKKEQILTILAFSSFPSHLYPTVPRSDYLKDGVHSKMIKLASRLQELSDEDLVLLNSCYPHKPAPDTRDLLGFIKNSQHVPVIPIKNALDTFLTKGQSLFRQDYQQLSSTREFDLERMLKLTYVTRGTQNERIAPQQGAKMMLMFQYLKELEQGQAFVLNADKPLSNMSEEELRKAFQACSDASSRSRTDERLQTQIWAILFEVLGRTTGKYPHLAQQFALIANEVLLTEDPSSILQLKTGEGKSHFVALRTARHAGLGRKVHVCTAKWSLAERDLLDYQEFFNVLGLSSANIHSRSAHDTYEGAQILYTTPGDLSLFLDEQASQGNPVIIDKARSVALGDEFDFLYYEGQKTQFNYARHTGITPKEMAWFYRGLNHFYDQWAQKQYPDLSKRVINPETVIECFAFLAQHAPEDGRIFLENLIPIQLLGWLQSADEAAGLRLGVDYSARLEQVKIGEEEFPLREIYPLTKDMQAAVGSTFSHGVHQLLAERLNVKAQLENDAQNYHVHPESDIISSQVFSQRLKSLFSHWEGFTGTVSSAQAYELNEEHGTAVLRVPTNQKDLRVWQIPQFFIGEKERQLQMVQDIKQRIADNKSILLCCATDAEVKEMDAALRTHFTEEYYEQHFLSYTNESYDTPAAILRKKSQMEGLILGQKEKGVVLIAAGFGRGDNVGVEAVMLSSVHDVNDLGQKGGRTARNGAEGEVLQYYMRNDIDKELIGLREMYKRGSREVYSTVANALEKAAGDYSMRDFFSNEHFSLDKCDPETKFRLLLLLREFLFANENYPSLVYHEAKALVSSEGIRLIGEADAEQKERLIKGFANYLNELEEEWMKLQTDCPELENRIDYLYQFIEITRQSNGRLTDLFHGVGQIQCKFKRPKKPQFLLDNGLKELKMEEHLMAEAQRLLLKIDALPESVKKWNELARRLSSLQEKQLKALLSIYNDQPDLRFDALLQQLKDMEATPKIIDELNRIERLAPVPFKALKLSSELQSALIAMPTQASNLVMDYLMQPGIHDQRERIRKASSLILFSSGNPCSLDYWEHSATRDALLNLPEQCLQIKPRVAVDANVLLGLKNFLDLYIDRNTSEERKTYVLLFQQFLKGLEHQPDLRVRLLTQFETILANCSDKRQVAGKIAQLSARFSAPEHFMLFKTLIDKMAVEYEKPRVSIQELDELWDDLLKPGSDLLQLLPLLEKYLSTEGKEFVSHIHIICHYNPAFIKDIQTILEVLPLQASKESSKEDRIEIFNRLMKDLDAIFSEDKPSVVQSMVATFMPFIRSEACSQFSDKTSLFRGMRELIAHGITTDSLFPKYQDFNQLLGLTLLCKVVPEHSLKLLELEQLAAYAWSQKSLSETQIHGIKILLEAADVEQLNARLAVFDNFDKIDQLIDLTHLFPEHGAKLLELDQLVTYAASQESLSKAEIQGIKNLLDFVSLDELKAKLPAFDNDNKLYDLLYCCHNIPEHTQDLISFEPVIRTIHSDYYQNELLDRQRLEFVSGLKVILDKKLVQADANLPARLNNLNESHQEKLLFLFKSFPGFVKRNSDTEFLPWVHYLCSDFYKNALAKIQESTLPGIENLLKRGSNPADIAQFNEPQHMAELLILADRFPDHADKLLAMKPLIELIAQKDEEEKEAARIAIGNLLSNESLSRTPSNLIKARLEVFTDNRWESAELLEELLVLAGLYPEQADKLLVMKPLIAFIVQQDDEAKDPARRALGHFFSNMSLYCISIDIIQDRIQIVADQRKLKRLLDYWQHIPHEAVSILCNNLPQITVNDIQQDAVKDLYANKNKEAWMQRDFYGLDKDKRIALMQFLKDGDFIIQVAGGICPPFSAKVSKGLFDKGLAFYKSQMDEILEGKSTLPSRDLSIIQQGQINAVMDELNEIGQSNRPIKDAVKASDSIHSVLAAQVSAYEQLTLKNKERYQEIRDELSLVTDSASFRGYRDSLNQIRSIKARLMGRDIELASEQWLPRLHFWGQSRLYKMLNDMEDTLIKAWMEDSRQQLVPADGFHDNYINTRDYYINNFRNALIQWNGSRQLGLFKRVSSELQQACTVMDDETLVHFLKDNPKIVDMLPGVLKSMAHEIVVHDSYIPDYLDEELILPSQLIPKGCSL